MPTSQSGTNCETYNLMQDSACVQQLKEMLLSQCKSYAAFVLPTLNSILSEPVGLLINERLVNIPSEIAPPLLNSLVWVLFM